MAVGAQEKLQLLNIYVKGTRYLASIRPFMISIQFGTVLKPFLIKLELKKPSSDTDWLILVSQKSGHRSSNEFWHYDTICWSRLVCPGVRLESFPHIRVSVLLLCIYMGVSFENLTSRIHVTVYIFVKNKGSECLRWWPELVPRMHSVREVNIFTMIESKDTHFFLSLLLPKENCSTIDMWTGIYVVVLIGFYLQSWESSLK